MATSKELLTNLADELRTLTNTTDKMGLSKMTEHVADANAEVDEQSAVVDELMAALQGKSVPGGGSGDGAETELCTVTIDVSAPGVGVYGYSDGPFEIVYDGTVTNSGDGPSPMGNIAFPVAPVTYLYTLKKGSGFCISTHEDSYISVTGDGFDAYPIQHGSPMQGTLSSAEGAYVRVIENNATVTVKSST